MRTLTNLKKHLLIANALSLSKIIISNLMFHQRRKNRAQNLQERKDLLKVVRHNDQEVSSMFTTRVIILKMTQILNPPEGIPPHQSCISTWSLINLNLNNVLTFSNTTTNTVGTTTLMLICGDKETSTALTCVMSNRIIKSAQLEERGAFMHTTGLNDCIM